MKHYKVGQTVYIHHVGYGRIIEVRHEGGVTDYYIRIYGGAWYDYFTAKEIR